MASPSQPKIPPARLRRALDRLYATYNRREFVAPDPLQVVYNYHSPEDREVVALIAAGLAYGRVASILKSIDRVLQVLGEHPAETLRDGPLDPILDELADFQHRWTRATHLRELVEGLHRVLNDHGSLNATFFAGYRPSHPTILPALEHLMLALSPEPARNSLLAMPRGGSACKRLHMFMRWMVRDDDVDLGGWTVPASKLLVPVDTHMHDIALQLGFTQRKQANLATALDITAAFRAIRPRDPVRYDFCLTRLGIRSELSIADWVQTL